MLGSGENFVLERLSDSLCSLHFADSGVQRDEGSGVGYSCILRRRLARMPAPKHSTHMIQSP